MSKEPRSSCAFIRFNVPQVTNRRKKVTNCGFGGVRWARLRVNLARERPPSTNTARGRRSQRASLKQEISGRGSLNRARSFSQFSSFGFDVGGCYPLENMNDSELLRRYAENGCETAFTELVKRHLDLVYSAALRQVGGDAHLAQDVAQTVFVDLARKASSISARSVLTGWLY